MIDLVIVLLFVTYSIATGFRYRRKASENIEEYFLAGRTLSGWRAGLSMAATQYSADTPLLVAGLVATAGVFSLWRLWVYAIAFLLMGFVLGASWRRASVITDAELTELRYNRPAASLLRLLKAIHLGTLINCAVLAMVLMAAARVAEPFLLWNEWLPANVFALFQSAVQRVGFRMTLVTAEPELWIYSTNNFISLSLIVAFTWLYSTTGGLRSVVATDVVQFGIMMLATLFYAVYVIKELGFGTFSKRLSELYGSDVTNQILSFGPTEFNEATMLFIAVLAVQWFAQINADGSGYLAQRLMACRSDAACRQAALVFAFAQVLLRTLLWLPIAVGLLILYPVQNFPPFGSGSEAFLQSREALFAQGIRDLLPPGIRGLMLTGMLAALASTVDTHLNWGASYWTNDLYKRFIAPHLLRREPGDRELVWVARFSNVGILILALIVAVNLNSIQSAWQLNLLLGSGLGVVLVLRWIWYRINVYSEFTAFVISIVCAPILLWSFPELSDEARLLFMLCISTIAVLVVTLVTLPESDECLRRFYQRVHPPGWWGPVAAQMGENRSTGLYRLRREVAVTAVTSLLLFGLLVIIGSQIVR